VAAAVGDAGGRTWRARHLLKEARRILKRRASRSRAAVHDHGAVRRCRRSTTRSRRATSSACARPNATLDEVMDDHLAFARKSTLREYAESIGVAIAVALLLRAFVVEAFQIPSGSMIPTLEVGDHIFVSKFSYGLSIPFTDTKILQYGTPQRGGRHRVQVPQDTSTTTSSASSACPATPSRPAGTSSTSTGSEIHRERSAIPCHYSEVSHAGVPDDHDCEHWVETLGDKVHDTILEPSHPATDHPRR
jgi:signal peptidase I